MTRPLAIALSKGDVDVVDLLLEYSQSTLFKVVVDNVNSGCLREWRAILLLLNHSTC
jgi:hypothetical protein